MSKVRRRAYKMVAEAFRHLKRKHKERDKDGRKFGLRLLLDEFPKPRKGKKQHSVPAFGGINRVRGPWNAGVESQHSDRCGWQSDGRLYSYRCDCPASGPQPDRWPPA